MRRGVEKRKTSVSRPRLVHRTMSMLVGGKWTVKRENYEDVLRLSLNI